MNIVGVQLIVAVFGLLMLYSLFLHWKKRDIGIRAVMAWLVTWGGLLLVNFFPKLFEPFISKLFFVRVFDFVAVLALAVLSYVMFENHIRINKLQKEIEKMVRKLAIKNVI